MAEHLTDEEQLARLRTWWQDNGIALLVGVVLVVAGVFGWRWYQDNQQAKRVEASSRYSEFLAAEGDQRAALAEQIVSTGAGTAYPAFVLLHQADAAVGDGDLEAAETFLTQAVEAASGPELADGARLRLARVLFDAGRDDEALRVLGDIHGAGWRALAAELQGDIQLASGDRALAHASYLTARSHVPAGEERPVLEMKIADTADSDS